jgi:hypothetical protein
MIWTHSTFADANALNRAIHQTVEELNSKRTVFATLEAKMYLLPSRE